MKQVGAILLQARERAGKKQRQLADNLGMDPSRVSRIERGEIEPSEEEIERYLQTLGGPEAEKVRIYRARQWVHLAAPGPWHPDADFLWSAETALAALAELSVKSGFAVVLRPQVDSLRDNLLKSTSALANLDHSISFVGGPARGKTTVLSLAANLVVPLKDGAPFENVALEAKGGRTTLCEVVVRSGPGIAILIEPLSAQEIELLVRDFVEGELARRAPRSNETEKQKGVPIEIGNAIRNMAELPVRTTGKGAQLKRTDSFDELIAADADAASLQTEILRRMNLSLRSVRELFFEPDQVRKDGMAWLQEEFRRVNRGLNKLVSLPRRLTVLIPRPVIQGSEFQISLIDTKGVDETAIRADIQNQLNDTRTLCVLCSSFLDAPDGICTGVLSQLREGGSDAVERGRVMLLVLVRPGEAMKIAVPETGEPVSSEEEGYAIRRFQIETALARVGGQSIAVGFFNAAAEKPEDLRQDLAAQLRRMRQEQVRRVEILCDAVRDLRENQDQAGLRQAQKNVVKALEELSGKHEKLPTRLRQPWDRLISEIGTASPRSIWASTRRAGEWHNFPVYHYLGLGTQADARRRSQQAVDGIKAVLDHLMTDDHTKHAKKFLLTLKDSIDEWQQEFLRDAQMIGQESYKPVLSLANDLWAECENRWGQGGGYRDDIGDKIREWFEEDAAEISDKVDAKVRQAWRRTVIQALRASGKDERSGSDVSRDSPR